jgi:hypothetical protein
MQYNVIILVNTCLAFFLGGIISALISAPKESHKK